MRGFLRFAAAAAASANILPLPPAATTATGPDVPMDDYMICMISATITLVCVIIFMAFHAVMTFYDRRNQEYSYITSPPYPETPPLLFAVELQLFSPPKRGLKRSALKALPKARYEKVSDVESQDECVICLTEFEDQVMIRKLPQCRHEFHVRCIDKWLRAEPTCPCCRTEVIVVPAPTSGLKRKRFMTN